MRLVNDDGDKLFEDVVGSSDPPTSIQHSGPLPPGEHTPIVESSSGFGFGAAATDTTGSASFDVTLAVGLPAADAHGDALPDDWETDGVDVDGNGTIDLDLPGMGADPRHVRIKGSSAHDGQAGVDTVRFGGGCADAF